MVKHMHSHAFLRLTGAVGVGVGVGRWQLSRVACLLVEHQLSSRNIGRVCVNNRLERRYTVVHYSRILDTDGRQTLPKNRPEVQQHIATKPVLCQHSSNRTAFVCIHQDALGIPSLAERQLMIAPLPPQLTTSVILLVHLVSTWRLAPSPQRPCTRLLVVFALEDRTARPASAAAPVSDPSPEGVVRLCIRPAALFLLHRRWWRDARRRRRGPVVLAMVLTVPRPTVAVMASRG